MTNLIFLIKVVTNLAQNWHVMDAKMCYYSSMENYLRVTFSMPIIYVEICIILHSFKAYCGTSFFVELY